MRSEGLLLRVCIRTNDGQLVRKVPTMSACMSSHFFAALRLRHGLVLGLLSFNVLRTQLEAAALASAHILSLAACWVRYHVTAMHTRSGFSCFRMVSLKSERSAALSTFFQLIQSHLPR